MFVTKSNIVEDFCIDNVSVKTVNEYPRYMISSDGRVFSKSYNNTQELKEMKLQTDRYGYNYIKLFKDGLHKMVKVHRLVAKTFLSNPDKYIQINHKNGIKTDNKVDNLEWCSTRHNVIHSYNTGLNKGAYGEIHGNSKLRNKDIGVILKLNSQGMTQSDIGKLYNVDRRTIGQILNGRTWSKVSGINGV